MLHNETLATTNTNERVSSNKARFQVESRVSQSSLLLSSLVLQLLSHGLDLLLLLSDQVVKLIQLRVSLELLLLKHKVILLNLVKNFFRLRFPFTVQLFEFVDFSNLQQLIVLVILDLLIENLKGVGRLGNLFIVLTIVEF